MRRVLLVHGLLRGPMSMMPLAAPLRRVGFRPSFFYYLSTFESWDRIVGRLADRLTVERPSIAIGHSLGGILLRLAMAKSGVTVDHLVMLGTPNQPPRLANFFGDWRLFRGFTGESGRFLSQADSYRQLPPINVPYTNFAGTIGMRWQFGDEPNDGVVGITETMIDPSQPSIPVPTIHTFLSASPIVRDGVLRICSQHRSNKF